MSALVEVNSLRVRYPGEVDALRGVDLTLERGESVAIVGESGSGKTTFAHCLAGLVQAPAASGSVRVDGRDVLGGPPELLRELRWATVALALQGTPFNPTVRIGRQVAEPLRDRLGLSAADAQRRVLELAGELHLDPGVLERYPHEVSGGERRRAMLAMVLVLDPPLVVLDEPTAGLDPASRRDVVEQIARLAACRGFALVVVSHDLPDVARLAERTLVMYAGEIAEDAPTADLLAEPFHPYSWALVNAYPVMTTTKDLCPIRGVPPDPRAIPPGCAYHPRCTQAESVCVGTVPALAPSRGRLVRCHFGGLKSLLAAEGIRKSFSRGRARVNALRGVDLVLSEGQSLGIIGPSGSGKSTLARILTGHLTPDGGRVTLEGALLPSTWRDADRARRCRIQLVMQDPWDALSPRLTVGQLVREPLDVKPHRARLAADALVEEMLARVGLPTSAGFLAARSHELSGGQLQRIALARALVAGPKVLVADEPTAMLDASEQARLLKVLRETQIEMGLGLVLVSHNLAAVRKVVDRLVVLDGGVVVEEGPSHRVCSAPQSLTTRRLLTASPTFEVDETGATNGVPTREGEETWT